LTPAAGLFSDEQKLTILQTAVHPLQELCQVKATAALLKVHTQKDLDYDAYSSLLLSTAADNDSKYVVSKGKRQIYAFELIHEEDDLYDASYERDPFDIDTPVDTIQAYASKFIPRSGMKEKFCMPKDKWFGLDQNTKDLWYKIDDKYKSIILGYTKSSSPSSFRNTAPSKPTFPTMPRRNINLHEMSAYESLQVNSHGLEPDPEAEETYLEESTNEVADSESPDTLLVGSHSNSLPPGDIC
jgi:hypothetical protein